MLVIVGTMSALKETQSSSFFEDLDLLPPDVVLENVRNAFISDLDERKVDLGAGIYRGKDGGDYVLPVVQNVKPCGRTVG